MERAMKRKAALVRMLLILGIQPLVFLAGCGGAASIPENPLPSSVPAITMISPSSVAAGSAGFTLTINGTNFVPASVVSFGGAARSTTFVSATQLTAAISASAIAAAGTANVTVTNPG
ncbi:MAG: IPT/TIG domain-containing protein, partial [Candidatus Acidiferrales bacterium]